MVHRGVSNRVVYLSITLLVAVFILCFVSILEQAILFLMVCLMESVSLLFFLSLTGDPGYIIQNSSTINVTEPVESPSGVFVNQEYIQERDDVPEMNSDIPDIESGSKTLNFMSPIIPTETDESIETAVNGYRECQYCHVNQPARAQHCRTCDKCVAMFDHHCTFLDVCIGERNRCRFFWFLFFTFVSIGLVISLLTTVIIFRKYMIDWITENLLVILVLVGLYVANTLVLFLLGLHTWLAFTGATTYEISHGPRRLWYLHGTKSQECDYPYSKGMCQNLQLFCCILDKGPVPVLYDRIRRISCLLKFMKGGSSKDKEQVEHINFSPYIWPYPGIFERDSTDICRNLWENKYWSCC
jgi:DHHC palmitoyltransferase